MALFPICEYRDNHLDSGGDFHLLFLKLHGAV